MKDIYNASVKLKDSTRTIIMVLTTLGMLFSAFTLMSMKKENIQPLNENTETVLTTISDSTNFVCSDSLNNVCLMDSIQ